MADDILDKSWRFIPFRNRDLVEMCLRHQPLANRLAGEEAAFRGFSAQLKSLFHHEFHPIVEALKDGYAEVDPDADTRQTGLTPALSPGEFITRLEKLLEKGNYERISQQDMQQALHASSLFKIRLQVDFDDFSEALLFCRGVSKRNETLRSLFGLIKKEISFINYDRVVLYIRFRDDYQSEKAALPGCKPGATLLKLFQNVPRADLEMLFPNTAVRMRTLDKLLIGVPAVISGGIVLTTKLGASLVLLGSLFGFWLGLSSEPVELNKTTITVLLAGMAALAGYLWKQFSNFKNRKIRFMQALTQNLYFKNLDNNAGVFHRLADDAAEEECKEALLAYAFLLADGTLTQAQLDHNIEQWLQHSWRCRVNFEIADALSKLVKPGLVQQQQGRFAALPLQQASAVLEQRWCEAGSIMMKPAAN